MKTITETGCQWYGYQHKNGTFHAKRYFDKKDIEEAEESSFVKRIFQPIEGTREDMLHIMTAVAEAEE